MTESASRRTRLTRVLAVVAGATAITLTLSGCVRDTFERAFSQELDCEAWTLTPLIPSGPYGSEDGPEYMTRVIDGNGVVLHESEPQSTFTIPTSPIVAGYYLVDDNREPSTNFDESAQYTTDCPGLAFSTLVQPSAGVPATTRTLPTFDVRFGEDVTGFTAEDLVFGGTAGVTGATVTEMSGEQQQSAFPYPYDDTIGAALYDPASFFRVTVTGVTRDGTISLQIPAGGAQGAIGDVDNANSASATASVTLDRTGPVISGINDITRTLAAGKDTYAASWDVTAEDPSGVDEVWCDAVSDSIFDLGDTLVTCEASDLLGNTSTASFTVRLRTTPTVTISPASDAVAQGGTAAFTVSSTDNRGVAGTPVASDYTVVSDVESDIIHREDGRFSVTFPHASPHTLTLTQTSTGATASVIVEVEPAPVTDTPAPITGGAQSPDAALATTGADSTPLIIAAGVLVLLGGILLIVRTVLRRRHSAVEPPAQD